MRKKSKLPIVVIVGRPNVGKSTMFNRLVGEKTAIISDKAGTTRDLIRGIVGWRGSNFELIDTAGAAKQIDDIDAAASKRINEAIDQADLVIMAIDGGVLPDEFEHRLARYVLKSQKPAVLAVNKSDKQKQIQSLANFKRLGIAQIVPISAISGSGCGDLLDYIHKILPTKKYTINNDAIRIAILGRPNAGKTSLLNHLSGSDEAIVSDQAGTTRDVNYGSLNYHGQEIMFADTAGLRRPGKIGRDIEYYSSLRTKKAIKSSDICVLTLDTNDLLSAQDQRIAGMIKDAGRGLIIAVNKWDIAEDKDDKLMAQISRQITAHYQFVPWAPLIFTSAKTGLNLEKLKQLIVEIAKRRNTKIPTAKLNKMLIEAMAHQAPAGLKNIKPKLNYIAQTGTRPPKFTIFASHPEAIHFSYKRYLENNMRSQIDFTGTPIEIEFKSKYR